MICQKHLARVKEDLMGALNEIAEFQAEVAASGLDSSNTGFGSSQLRNEMSMTYRMIEGLDNVLKIRFPDEYR